MEFFTKYQHQEVNYQLRLDLIGLRNIKLKSYFGKPKLQIQMIENPLLENKVKEVSEKIILPNEDGFNPNFNFLYLKKCVLSQQISNLPTITFFVVQKGTFGQEEVGTFNVSFDFHETVWSVKEIYRLFQFVILQN